VWDGACQAGDGFSVSDCNNKLIGARYYVDGFGRGDLDPRSHLSPYDDDGHGTHTASTAAGNYGVDPSIDGNDLGVDVISGISPRSYVAAYKVCWQGNGVTAAAGCSDVDTIAAIDDAVNDGVDVINFSVGGDSSTLITAESFAFLGAMDAGVFVANSAGNAGPGAGTVGTPASVPWSSRTRRWWTRPTRRRRARAAPAPRCAWTGRSIRRRSPARSCSACAAATRASTRASTSSGPAAPG
jgi:subtilisin family serine protease